MTSFFELVKSRRSIRKYDGRGIARKDLELCVEAGRHAPSACNSQAWKFVIVDDAEKKKKISDNVFSGLYGMNAFASGAAAFIIVISERIKLPARAGGMLRNTDFRRIDIGLACAHIVLQSQELGIGTCILGWFNEKRLKKILSVPRAKKIELVISLGYPASTKLFEKILKDKSETIAFNRF